MRPTCLILIAVVAFSALSLSAAQVDSPAPPTSPLSAMFSLEDIYNRLNAGTPGALRTGGFINPTTGPLDVGHTFNDIMAKAPASDNTNGATAAQVLSGKTYWSLQSGAWGTGTGTMPNNGAVTLTPGTSAQTIAAGFHNGSGTVSGDANLLSTNIKSGVSIFGVAGNTNVVNTSAGTAVAGDMLTGKTAFVAGALVTGTVPAGANVSGANGSLSFTIPNALYSGGKTATAADTNLTAANIKSGVSIFGVAGSTSVVDTSAGTAVAGNILATKTAYVNGALVTGTVPAGANVTGTNGSLAVTITDGLYSGSKTATAADTNLTAANIKSGATIFGVAGTAATATGNATATDVVSGQTFSNSTSSGLTGTRTKATLAKTGQTTSYSTGDDGSFAASKGQSVSPRFTNNGNGTVTDNLTGLIWLANANAFGTQTWATALTTCNTLASGSAGLTDGSTAGQWRLPNRKELESLVSLQYFNPALTNAAGTGQWTAGDPFTGVQSVGYWSSSTFAPSTAVAWIVYLVDGNVNDATKASSNYVWPVRGGQ